MRNWIRIIAIAIAAYAIYYGVTSENWKPAIATLALSFLALVASRAKSSGRYDTSVGASLGSSHNSSNCDDGGGGGDC